MILCTIDHAARYGGCHPGVYRALRWLADANLSAMTPGQIELPGGIFVKYETPALRPRDMACLETHRRYIDIHVPIKGPESIGWAPLAKLSCVREPYDFDRDIAFYGDAAHSMLHLRPGQLAIFFPEDAHAANIGIGTHRKLCIKIPL